MKPFVRATLRDTMGRIYLVKADFTPAVRSPSSLHDALVRAISKWMAATESGKQAYYKVGDTFNVTDLATNYSGLRPFLEDEGVKNLHIEGPLEPNDMWDADSSLVDTKIADVLEQPHND